ncbi:MAG: HAD family phosphatase [Trueperaceae bacterium]|nr:HAD family phosphatase [Trueperaceae bacterium]
MLSSHDTDLRLDLERPIRVFACDIDGCLAAASHADYELGPLGQMADLNRLSASDPSVPALTLVTGRPHAYVDAVTQLLAIDLPVSFENGAGFATRRPYKAWLAPAAVAGAKRMRELAAVIEGMDHLVLQPGKLASLSVFAADPLVLPLEELEAEVTAVLARSGFDMIIDPSTDCMNVLLPGVDKASGFEQLCMEIGVDPAEVAGIGDSVGDVEWLKACAVGIAPSNSVPQARAAASHPVDLIDVHAALAAYRALIEANRRLL